MLVALAAGLTLVPTVMVNVRDVRVEDVVRVGEGGRMPASAANRIVLRLPAGQRQVTLSGPAMAGLARRAGVAVEGGHPVTITLRAPARADRGCWKSTRALAAGETVTTKDVERTACGSEPAGIGEAAGATVVRVAVPAGSALGRLMPTPVGRVAPGSALTLRSATGPVIVERGVTTMQPGRSGRRVFVRDSEGQVFSAQLALVEDGR